MCVSGVVEVGVFVDEVVMCELGVVGVDDKETWVLGVVGVEFWE